MGRVRRARLLQSFAACVATAGLLVAWGCADDGIGTRYPVSGKVTYNGKPLEKGQINFQTIGPEGRSASGDIQQGEYKITTQSPGDGALPGKYRVAIIAKDVSFAEIEAISKKQGGTLPSRKDLAKAFQKAKRLIPAKYEAAGTSGLEADVKEQANTFDYSLTDK